MVSKGKGGGGGKGKAKGASKGKGGKANGRPNGGRPKPQMQGRKKGGAGADKPMIKYIKAPNGVGSDDDDDDEDYQVSKDDRKFFAQAAKSSKFLADLDRAQLAKQVRYDADPTAIKGKMNRPAVGDYWKEGGDEEGEGEDSNFADSDEDEDEFEEDDIETSYSKRMTANGDSEAKQAPRLPIKLASGKVVQPTTKLEKYVSDEEEDEAEGSEAESDEEDDDIEEGQSSENFEAMSYAEKELYHSKMKERLAEIAEQILENPEEKVSLLGHFQEIYDEPSITIKKLCLLTQFAVYRDILPGYAIRDLTEEEKESKVSKDVKKLRQYEETLLKHYQAYLQVLETTLQDFRRVKRQNNKLTKNGEDLGSAVKDAEKLAIIANKCMCDLLLRNTSFNFAKNLMASVVPRMCTHAPVQLSTDCCETVKQVFVDDNHGEPSLELVRLIAQLVKTKGYNVDPKVVDPLIHLRLLDEMEPPSLEPENQKNKKKGKKEFINKKKKKTMREDKELIRDLKEAEAEFTKEEKQKLHTQTLKIVFHIYFRILKNMQNGPLLMAILRGLAKFAHLISIDFFGDLMNVFKDAIANGHMDVPTSIQCILTGYEIISGQGESLTIDMKDFSLLLYKLLLSLAEGNGEYVPLAVNCLDHLIIKKKQLSSERVAAYAKRLSTVCLQLPSHGALCGLAMTGIILQRYPKAQNLLESEHSGMGTYMWELDDPDLSHAFETSLWELALLRKHYHPVVAKTAALLAGGELGVTKKPSEIFAQFDPTQGKLVPIPQFPKPHPLAKAQKKKTSFMAAPTEISPFLAQIEAEAQFLEEEFAADCREHFAVAKCFAEMEEMGRELDYSRLLIKKLKERSNKKRKEPPTGAQKPQAKKTKTK